MGAYRKQWPFETDENYDEYIAKFTCMCGEHIDDHGYYTDPPHSATPQFYYYQESDITNEEANRADDSN